MVKKTEDELFEEQPADDETEIKELMADDTAEEKQDSPEPKARKKSTKPKRVLTDEERARRAENLRVGREKSLANRRKKALEKKMNKEKEEEEKDQKIADYLEKKKGSRNMSEENARLRREIDELKKQKKPVVEEKKLEPIIENKVVEKKVIEKKVIEPPAPAPPPKKIRSLLPNGMTFEQLRLF